MQIFCHQYWHHFGSKMLKTHCSCDTALHLRTQCCVLGQWQRERRCNTPSWTRVSQWWQASCTNGMTTSANGVTTATTIMGTNDKYINEEWLLSIHYLPLTTLPTDEVLLALWMYACGLCSFTSFSFLQNYAFFGKMYLIAISVIIIPNLTLLKCFLEVFHLHLHLFHLQQYHVIYLFYLFLIHLGPNVQS